MNDINEGIKRIEKIHIAAIQKLKVDMDKLMEEIKKEFDFSLKQYEAIFYLRDELHKGKTK